MPPQNGHCKEMRLVLSSDAKPRLRWTSELHQQFLDAVEQLGGADKATPKSLMRVMGVHGLTLYHLKSHLQKYRMGRSQQCHRHNKQEDHGDKMSRHSNKNTCHGAKEPTNDLQMTRMQMEVQRKLHEQIEIQKHLQLRVEAQGKYLRTVLQKAEETISEYGSCSTEAENARAQLAELVSMAENTCPSSSVSELSQKHDSFILTGERNRVFGSVESSVTSSWDGSTQRCKVYERCKRGERNFLSLSLMEMPEKEEGLHVETFDLNNEFDLGTKLIDLNTKGVGPSLD